MAKRMPPPVDQLNQLKGAFFTLASHELRTPLTAIRGNISMVQHYGDTMNADEARQLIDDSYRSSVYLDSTINGLLDAIRILIQHESSIRLESCDLCAIVRHSLEDVAYLAEAKNLQMRFDGEHIDPMPVVTDERRVQQILSNLLHNAIVFTNRGDVAVSVEHGADSVTIRVTDTGIGLTPDQREKVFSEFDSAEVSRTLYPGRSVGMFVARLLAEALGGGIELEQTEPRRGSTFLLRLPVRSEA